jgi:uncharacterized protein (TIGR01777 family)
MRIAVTGSRGLIGSALVPFLRDRGHEVTPLVRRGEADGVWWDPASGALDTDRLDGTDAVIHLAGAGIGDRRWSAKRLDTVRRSRVEATAGLASALAALPTRPRTLISGSAVGYYGSRGDDELDESSALGSGFLADLCRDWEGATGAAEASGVRVVHIRTGVVLSAAGGALRKQLSLFRVGLGGRIGPGTQQLSWISRRDAVSALAKMLEDDRISGPVNLVAPEPVTNARFTKVLAGLLHRPAVFAVPTVALRLAFGAGMTQELLLASQRARPTRLTQAGFSWEDPDIEAGLRAALADR